MSKLAEIMSMYGIEDPELARHMGTSRQNVRYARIHGISRKKVVAQRYARAISEIIGISADDLMEV